MKGLRALLDRQGKLFHKGGKLEKLFPLWEAQDTFLYTPGETTHGPSHVRDALDLKRMMITVVIALIPAILMAMYNTGFQAAKAIANGAAPLDSWQTTLFLRLMGEKALDPSNVLACFVHGAFYFIPVLLVAFIFGGGCESLFAIIRKHDINEGYLVTGFLFPLTLPPTIPLWQVALGALFGVVIGKEIFGGTGMNILNPALVSRAFLFFAYPGQISGDAVWIAAKTSADGYSGATWLAEAAVHGPAALASGAVTWWDAFIGLIPGSMGETSAAACLFGAIVLVVTGVGSWRILLGVFAGSIGTAMLLNAVGSDTNPLFAVPFWWHLVLGGWAFGTVFMATEPVTASHSKVGMYWYGLFTGILAILIRVVNPAYPEGMMLAILFMNLFAALIDHFVVQANIKRRRARYAA
ncbi:MAG: NADH:ubiquinone reductase (Na(+)-transporting) subunit B [Acidobacteria bacterium]|nr:NADH:ubiquinone reductase (Na(+)-transporting) subunit B [Acidobacteriota bacterium]